MLFGRFSFRLEVKFPSRASRFNPNAEVNCGSGWFGGAHSARVWAAAARCSELCSGENAPLDHERKRASRRAAETGTRAERAPRS